MKLHRTPVRHIRKALAQIQPTLETVLSMLNTLKSLGEKIIGVLDRTPVLQVVMLSSLPTLYVTALLEPEFVIPQDFLTLKFIQLLLNRAEALAILVGSIIYLKSIPTRISQKRRENRQVIVLSTSDTEIAKALEQLNHAKERLTRLQLAHKELGAADLSEADLRHSDFSHSNLQNANFQSANLQYVGLVDTTLRGSKLEQANLWNANLTDADLRAANFTKANLTDATLENIQAQNILLNGAYLRRANLMGADLRGADLSGADLQHTNLTDVDFSGANFTGAKLKNAHFHRTVMPNGEKRSSGLFWWFR